MVGNKNDQAFITQLSYLWRLKSQFEYKDRREGCNALKEVGKDSEGSERDRYKGRGKNFIWRSGRKIILQQAKMTEKPS